MASAAVCMSLCRDGLRALAGYDPCRNPDRRAIGGHIINDHRVGTDAGVVTDDHLADDLRPCANENIISDDRAHPFLSADGHLVLDVNATPAAHGAVDDDAAGMDQHKRL